MEGSPNSGARGGSRTEVSVRRRNKRLFPRRRANQGCVRLTTCTSREIETASFFKFVAQPRIKPVPAARKLISLVSHSSPAGALLASDRARMAAWDRVWLPRPSQAPTPVLEIPRLLCARITPRFHRNRQNGWLCSTILQTSKRPDSSLFAVKNQTQKSPRAHVLIR